MPLVNSSLKQIQMQMAEWSAIRRVLHERERVCVISSNTISRTRHCYRHKPHHCLDQLSHNFPAQQPSSPASSRKLCTEYKSSRYARMIFPRSPRLFTYIHGRAVQADLQARTCKSKRYAHDHAACARHHPTTFHPTPSSRNYHALFLSTGQTSGAHPSPSSSKPLLLRFSRLPPWTRLARLDDGAGHRGQR